ncbi:hypothetical protein ACT3SP_06730 [Brachybacterium sp. AOP43-C2-M15]|uniref:hypothetical protein n=1 Tax=Brachybacterium sp. AOP43-C2-M15 TaxID=3457661 RepID=UPI00403346DC
MADWKTYAKAARNTARKQAPEARAAARRTSDRASGYVRAAGKAIDEGRREDGGREDERRDEDSPRTDTAARPARDGDRLRKDAAAYYTVAKRRADSANIGPRIMRALRDALLIGLSLFVIWGVLAAAGVPIPFTTVLIIVAAIVALSFGGGLYAQWKRTREAQEQARDRVEDQV